MLKSKRHLPMLSYTANEAMCVRELSYARGGWTLFFFSSRRRHTRLQGDWSSDVCSSDLYANNDTAMCQLLGMNCNTPTDVRFSFSGFTQRAGNTGDHTDGWGIAFFEDKEIGRASCRERV